MRQYSNNQLVIILLHADTLELANEQLRKYKTLIDRLNVETIIVLFKQNTYKARNVDDYLVYSTENSDELK